MSEENQFQLHLHRFYGVKYKVQNDDDGDDKKTTLLHQPRVIIIFSYSYPPRNNNIYLHDLWDLLT
jgi:hypothetical protein